MLTIDGLRKKNNPDHILVTEHARIRLYERNIAIKDVMKCIEIGEIIRQYEDDKPFPSCLILGMSVGNKYMHVVVSDDGEYIHLITAYYPDSEQWENDFKTRKGRKL